MTTKHDPLNFSYDYSKDVMTIDGIKYSGELFRGLAFKIVEDEYFQIIERENGVITVQVTRSDNNDEHL